MFDFDRNFFADCFNEYNSIEEESLSSSCKHDNRVIAGHLTCILCGEVNIDRPIYSELIEHDIYKPYFIYHRKSYFREKLRLLAGIKQSLSPDYPKVINTLKTFQFSTLIELKKLMQKNGYHRYYKYIYNIFYEVTGKKLIVLNPTQISFLTLRFLKIEHAFKKSFPVKSNILSYNIIIHSLLKNYGYDCYKHILLPKNYRKLVKNITDLLKSIETY